MELVIDNRENIKTDFNNQDTLKYDNLEVGDYLIKYKDKDVLVIERKTINDYCASIKDGRHREQKKRLLVKYSKNQIIYLVEGDLDFIESKYNRVNSDTLTSSILNTMMRDGIHVFHTKDSKETIFFIESICKKISKQGITFLDSKTTHHDDLFNNLSKTCHHNLYLKFKF